jgi:hypothetical protein
VDLETLGIVANTEHIKLDPANPDKSISDAQIYVHNHDMKNIYIGASIGAGLLIILAVVVILYYTRSNPD